jgi:hypothetical protein
LASIPEKTPESASYKVIYIPENFSRIPVVKVIFPAGGSNIDFFYYLYKRLFITTLCFISDFLLQFLNGTLGWKNVEVIVGATVKITIVPQGKAKKIKWYWGLSRMLL